MDEPGPVNIEPRSIPATTLVHQEGVLGVIALSLLAFRDGGPLTQLRPAPGRLVEGLAVAVVAAAVSVAALNWCRRIPALHRLQAWQARLVSGWSTADGIAVSLLSGIAEEALMRAVLQPVVGLLAAAALFAVLHIVPDRELWLWPVLAFLLGVGFGALFARYGYPAAAAAHVSLNLLAIQQLRAVAPDPVDLE